jgi:CheY-like chemotaxis protein
VTQGIVRHYGGAIFVDSAPGRGTTVSVLFPVSEPESRADQEEPIPPSEGELPEAVRERPAGMVLLVDDEDVVRDVARAMLERLGYEVLTAGTGQEAVDLFRARGETLSCTLLDLTMPGMDGWHTLKAIREVSPAARVVLATGYDIGSMEFPDSEIQPSGWLQKPYRFADLRTVLPQP